MHFRSKLFSSGTLTQNISNLDVSNQTNPVKRLLISLHENSYLQFLLFLVNMLQNIIFIALLPFIFVTIVFKFLQISKKL